MKQVLVVSGKGGTGKTSVTACFGMLASKAVMVDCDVDAANLYLLMTPQSKNEQDFYCGFIASVDVEICYGCGKCVKLCRFDALEFEGSKVSVKNHRCEGCGVCHDNCPQKAIRLQDRYCGKEYLSYTRFGTLVHAKLDAGGENSGKLVSSIRQRAVDVAQRESADLILIDGPPGIGCPVIASVGGCDYAVVVCEPTVSGVHDLKRIVKLLKHFGVATGIIINKADLNEPNCCEIEQFTKENNLKLLGKLSYDNAFTQAQKNAKTLLEFAPQSKTAADINSIWKKLKAVIL